MKHIIAGLIFAPVIPFLPFLVGGPLFLAVLIGGAAIVYPAAIILGLPLFLWVNRKPHLQRASTYIVGGALVGFLAMILLYLALRSGGEEMLDRDLKILLWPILHGAASGYVFWLYVRPIMRRAT